MDVINRILQLPERCLLNKKITKAFFKRNFDLTSAERSLLDDYNVIEAINWVATISPANSNIIAWKDEQYIYEEVQVITVQTTVDDFVRNKQKIAELIQKYIPYPIILCIYNDQAFVFNTFDKKINQNDSSRRTIDKRYFSEDISQSTPTKNQQDFLNSINFTNLDKTNLQTYYNAYTQRIISLQVASLSGVYIPRTHNRTQEDLKRLERIEELKKEIISLQNRAKKETQLNQRVQLNVAINDKRKEIERLTALI
ncbi:DUF4391 domain-containing protein [Mucilaginibacter flavidus]|uniref:DUF4391 domain-containing protein n=1 Tax=Mucilaginibacter flavidus TaxID=2949309 RepID=UPI002093FB6B|nr:DUF4391 domain-containing protein [Mucilaginibacter flavidus]MCO5948084.1 DUF4391 domain-containing protein [Mucilaginibacter flavidus]